MLRIVRLLAVVWGAVLLQTVLAPRLEILGVRPDFPFLVVLLVAFREGSAGGALAGFVAGLFVDLESVQALGVTSLANALLGFAVGSVADRLVRTSVVTRLIVALVATTLRDEIVLLLVLSDGFLNSLGQFFRAAIPAGIYTGLIAAPVMSLAERLIGWPPEGKASRAGR